MNPRPVLDAWRASEARREVARLAHSAGIAAFAVGGAVRDALLGREPHDWDVAAEDAMRLARAVAERLDATFVWLHDAPATCRVVIGAHDENIPREELDFSDFRGASLEEDLRARDFTINSLAWPLGAEPGELTDPCAGCQDLQARLIRANSANALAQDPLRCLRAYRLAAELEFDLEPMTSLWIEQHAAGLADIAGERVGMEFMRLVQRPGLSRRLEQMRETGVLKALLPELLRLEGVMQGGYHHLDVWGHTLLVLDEIERIATEPDAALPESAAAIRDYLLEPGRLAQLKLAGLLHDIAKPDTRTVEDGKARFIGHESLGATMAAKIAARLRLPRTVRSAVSTLTHWHMRPILLVDSTEPTEPTLSAVRRLLRDCDPDGIGVIVLAAADLLACRGPATDPADQRERLAALDRMIVRSQEWEQGQEFEPLLQGRDLIAELQLEPGPHFSVILDEIERTQLDGEIRTRDQALELARRIVAEGLGATRGEQ